MALRNEVCTDYVRRMIYEFLEKPDLISSASEADRRFSSLLEVRRRNCRSTRPQRSRTDKIHSMLAKASI